MPDTDGLLSWLKQHARALKMELLALAWAARDPRTPWLAKVVLALVLLYAASPIDLIPDFIPVLGYLDDLLLLPAGIWLALRLIPPEVMAQARAQAGTGRLAQRRAAALVVVGLWLAGALWLARWAGWL